MRTELFLMYTLLFFPLKGIFHIPNTCQYQQNASHFLERPWEVPPILES